MRDTASPQTMSVIRTDRLIRYVLVPLVVLIGLIGLVRYVATGEGQSFKLDGSDQVLNVPE